MGGGGGDPRGAGARTPVSLPPTHSPLPPPPPPPQVGNRIIKKRIHVRIEHVVPSRCKEEFLARRAANDAKKAAAKAAGEAAPKCKRAVAGPRDGFTITDAVCQTITAIPYDIVKDAKI